MTARLFSEYKMLVVRLTFPSESAIHSTPFDLCTIEHIKTLGPDSYWVRVRAISLDPFSQWHTIVFTPEQHRQSLLLEPSLYLLSKQVVSFYQPALTTRNHSFLGGFVIEIIRPFEQEDAFLASALSVSYAFTSVPEKMELSQEQIVARGILLVPEWQKHYTTHSERQSSGQKS